MKPKYILPAAVLVISAVLLLIQRLQIQELNETISNTRKIIDAAAHAKPTPPAQAKLARHSSPVRSSASIKSEIRKLAPMARISPFWNGLDTSPEVRDFVIRIQEMNDTSLLATLEVLDTMDLDSRSRGWFENLIVHQLADQYPETMLNHCRETLRELRPERSSIMESAIRNWTKADPAAATAWLDREIAAGTFESQGIDPENQMLAKFEGVVLSHRMSIDPNGTIDRLTSLPLHTQIEILHSAERLDSLSPEQKEILTPLAHELTKQISDEIERTGINPLEMWFKP